MTLKASAIDEFSSNDLNSELRTTTQFPRTQAEGAQALGQFERQTFEQGDYTLSVDVGFEQRTGMARGVVVPQGSLRLTQSGGWELIMPVGGLVACESP